MSDRYPTPQFRRTALAPGILTAIVLFAGLPLIDTDGYIVIQFAVSILALILCVFAWQAKQWWWLIGLAPIAVLFNPVLPVDLDPGFIPILHYLSVLVVVAAAVFIRVPNPEDRNRR